MQLTEEPDMEPVIAILSTLGDIIFQTWLGEMLCSLTSKVAACIRGRKS